MASWILPTALQRLLLRTASSTITGRYACMLGPRILLTNSRVSGFPRRTLGQQWCRGHRDHRYLRQQLLAEPKLAYSLVPLRSWSHLQQRFRL